MREAVYFCVFLYIIYHVTPIIAALDRLIATVGR